MQWCLEHLPHRLTFNLVYGRRRFMFSAHTKHRDNLRNLKLVHRGSGTNGVELRHFSKFKGVEETLETSSRSTFQTFPALNRCHGILQINASILSPTQIFSRGISETTQRLHAGDQALNATTPIG